MVILQTVGAASPCDRERPGAPTPRGCRASLEATMRPPASCVEPDGRSLRGTLARAHFAQRLPRVVENPAAEEPALQAAHGVVEQEPVCVERVGLLRVRGVRVETEQ